MSLRILAASILSLAVAVTAAAQEKRTITVATEGAFEPFNYTDPSGKVRGFDIDITNAVCADAGLTCKWVKQDWDGLIPGLLAGKFDAISASMSITDERKKSVAFTNKLYQTAIRFVAAKGSLTDTTPAALAGKRLGAQRATIAAIYLQQNYGKSDVKLYDTQDAMRLDLTAGRIDALLADEVATQRSFLAKPDGSAYAFFGPEIKIGDGIGIALRKDETDILDRLNKGIAQVRSDGTFQKISAKYFPGFDIY
jgi:lysine-arginine-ornithine-binding protein